MRETTALKESQQTEVITKEIDVNREHKEKKVCMYIYTHFKKSQIFKNGISMIEATECYKKYMSRALRN